MNFVNTIWGDDKLIDYILTGHKSTVDAHLSNISQRVGRTSDCDLQNGHIQNDKKALQLWSCQ